jgi:putative ABC transport system permease protein
MKYFIFLLRTALENFRRNKTRTILASLGIMIGVLSVVLMIALGLGLRNYIQGQFEGLGANLVLVFPGSGLSRGAASFGPGLAGGAKFDEKDVASLQKVNELTYVVPVFLKSVMVEAGGESKFGYVFGTNEQLFPLSNLEPIAGEILTKSDVVGKSKKVVLGYTIADDLFEKPEDAAGKFVRIDNQRYSVIGVIKKKNDNETDHGVFMSYKTTFGNLNPGKTFFAFYLGVSDEEKVEQAKNDTKETLLKRYKADDFSVSEQSEILSTINQIFTIINSFLIAIGSISLLVGGIGIMNIMYANVTERTKEIGIRRALGATRRDILFQFLMESVLLSAFGGVIALIISSILVFIIHNFFPVALNVLAVFASLGISTAIGVFFGVFPARRASKLTPIEAIRYE